MRAKKEAHPGCSSRHGGATARRRELEGALRAAPDREAWLREQSGLPGPPAGLPAFARWLPDVDPDVRWIVRQNLAKARLVKVAPGWVEEARRTSVFVTAIKGP